MSFSTKIAGVNCCTASSGIITESTAKQWVEAVHRDTGATNGALVCVISASEIPKFAWSTEKNCFQPQSSSFYAISLCN